MKRLRRALWNEMIENFEMVEDNINDANEG